MNQEISFLSDSELINQLTELVRTEREITEQVIRHLAELEKRKLYAEMGYSSLFDYATKGLGYSESAAVRRIKAARVGVKAPEVFDYLERGEMTLSTVEVLSRLVKEDNGAELLEQFRGKSREEAEEIVAFMQPVAPSSVRDRITIVVVGETPEEGSQPTLNFEGKQEPEENSRLRSEVKAEKRYSISFSADEDFMSLLNRAKELAFRGDKKDLALEKILRKALTDYVGKRCPKERERRRQERRERRMQGAAAQIAPKECPAPAINEPVETSAPEAIASLTFLRRKISAVLRDQILSRDNFQCSYVSPMGVKCCSPWDLEIDHIEPIARGGETTAENLRVLCRAHNLSEARRAFGKEFIETCILEKQLREVPCGVGQIS